MGLYHAEATALPQVQLTVDRIKHNDISNLLISIELVGDILNLCKSLNCRFVKQKRHTVLFKYLVSNQKDVK